MKILTFILILNQFLGVQSHFGTTLGLLCFTLFVCFISLYVFIFVLLIFYVLTLFHAFDVITLYILINK